MTEGQVPKPLWPIYDKSYGVTAPRGLEECGERFLELALKESQEEATGGVTDLY